jgi:threonine synthase
MFIETRGNDGVKPSQVEFSEAILSPSASVGGLYVPKKLPTIDQEFIESHKSKSYKELACDILKLFEIDIDDADIQTALDLYDAFDDSSNPAPVVKVKDDLFSCELYHGPTRAFKDMALQPFGSILSAIAKKRDEKYLILAATSGDTGPAALSSFRNKENIKVACLYPDGGTSDVQRLQMVTEDGNNLKVIGINGNFDDAQNALKDLLASDEFKESLKENGYKLSAANSVNFGRIIFQIIYHFSSYIQLLNSGEITTGESIEVCIPSGNFGNALGAYYAKKMGLPISKILIASNRNNILTSWINDGKYDLNNKELVMTKSPAMDILKSSNIERILFDMFGSSRTKELMDHLADSNKFELSSDELSKLQDIFSATYSDDEYGVATIKSYLDSGYLMDPHTATCIKAYDELHDKSKKLVICSTAEWTKFSPTVLNACQGKNSSDEEALKEIANICNIEVPSMIDELFSKDILHTLVVDKEYISREVKNFIKS